MIHELLTAAAERHGGGIAVLDGERTLTYAELDERSDRLAAALVAQGVAVGDRVGLALEKSAEAVVAIYGVLKAGATYVPLDDQAPTRRLAYILRDAGIGCLVSSQSRAPVCKALLDDGVPLRTVVGLEDQDVRVRWLPWNAVNGFPAQRPNLPADPDRLAYILYTSGSTGEPKGVMLSHENCLAFVSWAAREVCLGPDDRVSSHAPFHFDLSTFDLFASLSAASTVVLVERELSVFPIVLAKFIAEHEISVWYSVPSALTALVLRGELQSAELASLRTIIFAGEVFPIKHLSRLIELLPGRRYLNFYGPTETNVCTWHEVLPVDLQAGELPIGRPLPGVEAWVLGEDGAEVAEGETGELAIGGATVMHGYWGDPQRNERALRVDETGRRYMTGDLVRRRADGALMFSGRRDMQVKTRGYRVELGEIEAALNALDVVLEAAVVAVPDETITNRLKAFVATTEPTSRGALTRMCRERLPAHMIPEEIEFREELPKSSTGKIDRRALH
jgi:L-proline---[L-prolyl-carrier protein] ligase